MPSTCNLNNLGFCRLKAKGYVHQGGIHTSPSVFTVQYAVFSILITAFDLLLPGERRAVIVEVICSPGRCTSVQTQAAAGEGPGAICSETELKTSSLSHVSKHNPSFKLLSLLHRRKLLLMLMTLCNALSHSFVLLCLSPALHRPFQDHRVPSLLPLGTC